MEPFYYNHMNKNQQAAYRAMQQGLTNLSDEFQIPRLEGKDLSNVFFELPPSIVQTGTEEFELISFAVGPGQSSTAKMKSAT